MAYINLPLGSALAFNGNGVTEHNRSELGVEIQRIESSDRMANGAMRKYVVADKRKWNVSWEMCPNDATKTVDGKWGGTNLLTFYSTTPGVFTLTVKNGSSTETYNAVITDFSYDIIKRSTIADAWNINMTIEEA